MYDIHTKVAPINLINQFTKTRTMHNYNTRSSSNECFTVKTSRTLRSLNKSGYQNKIKKLLLDVLNCEDDYIEVSKLIKHFATLT